MKDNYDKMIILVASGKEKLRTQHSCMFMKSSEDEAFKKVETLPD